MPPLTRRLCFVDRHLFAPYISPITESDPRLPSCLVPHVAIRNRLHDLLDKAFPPANAPEDPAPTLSNFRLATQALDGPLALLVSPLDPPEPVNNDYAALVLEAHVPELLVKLIARILAFRHLASEPHPPSFHKSLTPTWRSYLPVLRQRSARHLINSSLLSILRAINAFTNASDLVAARFAADSRLIPLLFDAMRAPFAVDLSLTLIEDLLLVPRHRPDLDLSSVKHLPALIASFTPFQLGCFCRVLAPLVDERDFPLCGGDHCSGACASQSGAHDWQQIEPATKQLRARRSYTAAASRAVRDRNHAALLAVPALIDKLAKLVSVPPAPRDELILVDHILRSGFYAPNLNFAEGAQPVTLQAAFLTSVQGDQNGAVVVHQMGGDVEPLSQQAGPRNGGGTVPQQQQQDGINQRLFFMVFPRLTGQNGGTTELAETESWHLLDARVRRAARDYANGIRDTAGVFRERRRRVGPERVRVSFGGPPGATQHSVLEIATVPGLQPNGGEGTSAGHVTPNTDSGTASPPAANGGNGGGSAASSPTRRGDGQGQRTDRDEGMENCPPMTFNGLLMSSHQAEVLFVLYSLLIGRRKADVQAKLIEAGIFPALQRFCDALDWSKCERETKTEESLKIHVIRLLHYMWDGLDTLTAGDRLEVLFSDHERDALKSIGTGDNFKPDSFGSHLTSPTSPARREPLHLTLRNLSLNSCNDSSVATPSSSVENETDPHGSLFRSSPFRNIRPLDLRGAVLGSTVGGRGEMHHKKGDDSHLTECASDTSGSLDDVPTDSERGIVCKMVKILMKMPCSDESRSTRRCLLSGCFETYLRNATMAEKTLVAHQGLLTHLLKELSESDNLTPQVRQFRQTGFDLLGQLVKWNRRIFAYMNELFRQDPKLLPQLLKTVSYRLVDSNVFVRSAVISLERFRGEDELARSRGESDATGEFYDFENCLVWEFVETNRTRLIHDLLSSVRVEDVNFENICCVNTTLILLVTSCRNDESLDATLYEIADAVLSSMKEVSVEPPSLFALRPVNIFENFNKLVDFWLNYYQHQSLDVASQELSSNIHFERLVAMAHILRKRLPLINSRIRREASAIRQQ